MRFVKFLLILLLIAAIAAVSYFLLGYYNVFNPKELTPVSMSQLIPFARDEKICFFKNGFIITGESPRYFDNKGNKINNPFSQNDLIAEDGAIGIKLVAGDYICTESNTIYNTSTLPFKCVFENTNNLSIYNMKEGSDYMLLLIEVSENVVEPYVLLKNTDLLLSYDGRGDAKYISSAIYEGSKDVSILSISLDTPMPVTRVFNYINRNEAYGAITVEDQLLYDIYRIEHYIILIGTDTIICYNINGQYVWTVENPSRSSYEAVYLDGELLLYFNESIQSGDSSGNGVKINENSEIEILEMPRYLSNINAYDKGYVAIELGNTIVMLDDKGQPKKRYKMEGLVRELYISKFHDNIFYIKTQNNTLGIYTNLRKDEQD